MKVIFDLEKDDFHKLECMQEAVNKRLGITPSIILPMEEAVLLGIINGLNAQFGISIPVEG
ncbi:MAG: hypothetical protein COX77_01915, partial [Candidatus Komeilibacteria bacterium CG_4_10_14_0_2_um_filter_37_10]